MKERTRGWVQAYCRGKRKRERRHFERLQGELANVYAAWNAGDGFDKEGWAKAKEEMRLYFEGRARQYYFQCQGERQEKDERCSAYFFQTAQAARSKRVMGGLQGTDGKVCKETAEMVSIATEFYSELFAEREVDRRVGERFLGLIEERVPEGVGAALELPVSLEELHKALVDQTCGVEGRTAVFNLQLVRDVLEWVDDRGLPLIVYRRTASSSAPEPAGQVPRGGWHLATTRGHMRTWVSLQQVLRPLTIHMYNPFVKEADILCFLARYCVDIKEGMKLRNQYGVWNGKRRYNVRFRQDPQGVVLAGTASTPAAASVPEAALEEAAVPVGDGKIQGAEASAVVAGVSGADRDPGAVSSVPGPVGVSDPVVLLGSPSVPEPGLVQGSDPVAALAAAPVLPLDVCSTSAVDPAPVPDRGQDFGMARIFGPLSFSPVGPGTSVVQSDPVTPVVGSGGEGTPVLCSPGAGVGALSPSAEGAALLTSADLATPTRWEDSPPPEGGQVADWARVPVKKRVLSGDKEELCSAAKSAPVVEWWEAAKARFKVFCQRYSTCARRRERAEVRKWLDSLSYLHAQFNSGVVVDWAKYEGVKERVRRLLEGRVKTLAFQARIRELEEGEKPSAYFFQAVKAHVLSPAYQAVVSFLRQCPSPLARDDLQHRVLYARLAFRQIVAPSGALLGIDWGKISGGNAPGMVRDIQWRCALGRLPVREVMYRRGCAASALCPRGCGESETVPHALWDCQFARGYWALVLSLLRRAGPSFALTMEGALYQKRLGVLGTVSSGVLWDVLGYSKWVLWEDRIEVVGRRERILTPSQLYYRFRGRVAERVKVDGAVRGHDWVQNRWGGLARVFSF
ncbi:hypothetical protein SKAU_G00155020 [Synaphobranchus kaupii]|uniref:Zinc finger CCHC domain-containing protein n=1 Tax=Synaphobranchus kaupii TaxID=118154 RepID=A0A9Q1FHU4_SYNKA|nr:hypothetical protein SKAU_G00155020 [Synaphobranchus kaupii]